MSDPISDEERALLEHRWAVLVDLPGQASHAAQVARRLVDDAADAHLDAPAVVVRAVEALEGRRSPSTSGWRRSRPSSSAAAWARPPSSGTWNAAPAVHHPTRPACDRYGRARPTPAAAGAAQPPHTRPGPAASRSPAGRAGPGGPRVG
jgi:hypothetical protein